MATEESGLPEEGLALWLTEWKTSDTRTSWLGRQLVASIGRSVAGELGFLVHPDGQAVKVAMLDVHPDFQRRRLAGVLMDALYAAYPTAWINHGWRTTSGSHWWNGYRDPAPERNVHNRPPAEWAAYFDAVSVAADRAHNAHQNDYYGLHGHRDALYRHGERLETEAALHAASFRPAPPVRVDPAAEPLHGAARLVLPPSVHAYVHDRTQDSCARATALLEHVGHGNLPHDAYWNSTRQAAFADAHHEELTTLSPPVGPATHVVFTLSPLDITAVPGAQALATSVDFTDPGDLAVGVAELSWRQADRPYLTHTAAFTPAVEAAIAPVSAGDAGNAYRNRYDEEGFLRPASRGIAQPFADRAAQIQAMTERLLRGRTAWARTSPAPTPAQTPVPQPQAPQQPQQRPPGPGRRA
ncbi:GNAT family N-acetyltransferase [Streptomyces griseorubiginosus]|uniref:GNAT family N-acetyltransferase n=1 Tax=Streptomyces griseorubiginosus TaxID=67304 RepID=UPI0036E75D63